MKPFLSFLALASLFATSAAEGWEMKQAPLMTQWASQIDTNNPLPEYPRPQLVRTDWMNLNGIWQFQFGVTNTDPVPTNQTLASSILVPYPMESAISGVMQYSPWSWYRRTFTVPPSWAGKRVILHLDAVDWQSQVYINGQSVGLHKGGYDPVSYDITAALNGTVNEIIVQVFSPEDNGGQPRGKQTLYPGGIMYTSASGIWQPVWLEPVDSSGVQSLTLIPDIDNSRLRLTVNTFATNGVTVQAAVTSPGRPIINASGNPGTEFDIPISDPQLWTPNNPFLYNLQISVVHNGVTNDVVTSYFGMRKISLSLSNGVPQMLLNNQFVFEMGPLDQGFWPDGIYTAPTDAALAYDLQEEKALGFNTVRKHIKVERQRWYYWADKLGLMVWQDMPSCNSYTGNPNPPAVDPVQFSNELTAMVTNHWNSPAIIMWDIFNEDQGEAGSGDGIGQSSTASLVQLVKTLDPSRLVNQASGGAYFGVGDVLDSHNYPDPGNPVSSTQAAVDGEFGGIAWHVNGHLWNPAQAGDGYLLASSLDNIAQLYDGYINEAVNFKTPANGGLNAAIYTQITDVENECNGLMTYDRLLKPDLNKINLSNQKAITGTLTLSDVLPTSQSQGRTWKYTTTANTGSLNWFATNFNDSAWSSGLAGFGTAGTPNAVVRTTWNTSDIWIRQQFTLGALSAADRSSLVFNCYHDEDCEIYLNGVLAGSASGYASGYVLVPMNSDGMNALIPNATNLIAVHCHQTTGGQNIDVGITKKVLIANTLTVPNDPIGYWPLDATTGTTATDATGNGDNGVVTAPTWDPHGQIGGCLDFDGASTSVRIGNLISNDFTIAFWVKTTQIGGASQWYNGAGLVDGDVPFSTNDFGTALVGDYFAFGVGNPDITILSVPINDGAWHHCVATRLKSTGAFDLYVDGNFAGTGGQNTNSLNSSSVLRFGQISSGGNFFKGSLDEVRIYNRALGNFEVSALYSSTAFPSVPPINVTATIASGQVTLNWSGSQYATNYLVSRSTTSGGPYTLLGSTAATSFTDANGVTDGTTYYYVVSAADAFGPSVNSAEISAKPYALAAWFKADAITGVTNGGAVSVWPDVSGNTNNATNPNPLQQPTLITGALHDEPVVRFNGAASNYLAFNRPVQDDFTIICIFSARGGVGTGTQYYQGAGIVNGEVAGVQDDFGISINTNGALLAGTGDPDITAVAATQNYANNQTYILTFERTRSSGALALYADGLQVATATGGTQSLTAPGVLTLGAQQTLINFLTGDIAEVKIFNTALSDNDRAIEEGALGCKYGLGAGSGPGVPANLTAMASYREVICNWTYVSGADSYTLSRGTNAAGPFQVIASGLTSTSFMDSSATGGATNYYQISAANACGNSDNSTTVAAFLPSPLVGFIGNSSANALTLTWPASVKNGDLYFTTNLTPPIVWLPVTNSVTSNADSFSVTLPVGRTNLYFHLKSP